jgi:molybdopterin-guanine dinucleotide biosynthesis protein A
MEIASIILAGGKGLRLGRSKAKEIIGGKTLIERVIRQLRKLSKYIYIATSREQSGLFKDMDAEVLVDIYPDSGPLGGIYTGLMSSPCQHNIVVACDMPFLNTDLLGYMVELSRDFDAVVPRLSMEYVEPLHAVYSKACLDGIKSQLDEGRLQVILFLSKVRVRYIEREECQRLDPNLLSFFNINYQPNLDWAIAMAAEKET